MQRRQITLEDGRYLVFYTFEEETTTTSSASVSAETAGGEQSSAPVEDAHAEPQATEERRV
jgi:hypothetical protein